MIDYLKGLNNRERTALIIGMVVCFLYIGYLFIYAPLTAGVHRRALILSEKKDTLQWIKQAQAAYQPSKKRITISNTQLLALVSQALNKQFHGFTYQLQQTGAGNIQLMYETVPFNAFMRWLYTLNKEYAVSIQELIVDKTATSGIVKLTLVITPG